MELIRLETKMQHVRMFSKEHVKTKSKANVIIKTNVHEEYVLYICLH